MDAVVRIPHERRHTVPVETLDMASGEINLPLDITDVERLLFMLSRRDVEKCCSAISS